MREGKDMKGHERTRESYQVETCEGKGQETGERNRRESGRESGRARLEKSMDKYIWKSVSICASTDKD